MATTKRPGTCRACDKGFDKRGMQRHLASCPERRARIDAEQAEPGRQPILHLFVEGWDAPEYWMHLELPATTTLDRLDEFLRATWLECCGHMSAFLIGQKRFGVEADPMLGFETMQQQRIDDVVEEGEWFGYEYDFGSTTPLRLRVVGRREGVAPADRIAIIARNDPPDVRCACGRPATEVCTFCFDGPNMTWLCETCAPRHACDEEMRLPVVNSPRVGVCGYSGPY